mmetsp:Transcript_25397/g.46069  ORF Transcript_25397/g.46069 Transcript_25397/m.46069 type:complete len:250 (-) Transcript_25397:116-865(-)|eukprot:CAMPEP_0197642840 /NCGR_PEP_ID=MMETSP1338-20131121/16378_1 /TAXON_ID=43686 ORGANISM="Pelagodinium beii, Strain RCC1491" /NCGR_SAMPLE_ID=MMETSP1338 /ASSEMBLY_ACC=CAM_ASM_000754 /LENGTH=249 /DNA_ID=CAMNT_0043216023 /DNA_START=202 /DNA_END=951 /DNA_ORIENTATION=-
MPRATSAEGAKLGIVTSSSKAVGVMARIQTSCAYVSQGGGKSLFLIGDSHAQQLLMGMARATTRQVKWHAWFEGGPTFDPEHHAEVVAQQLLQALKPGDVVFVAVNMNSPTGDPKAPIFIGPRDWWPGFMEKMHSVTISKGAKLVLVGDVQHIPMEPKICLLKNNDCASDRDVYLNTPRRIDMNKFVASHRDVLVFDLMQHLCTRDSCNMYVPGSKTTMAFECTHHISSWAAIYLAPFLCDFLAKHDLE